jgi:hypothetical protein
MPRFQYAGLELISLINLSKRWGPSPFLWLVSPVTDTSFDKAKEVSVSPSSCSDGKILYSF